MREVALGDRSAFGQLFDRYNQLALNLAARVLNERQEAEDVVQEVFLQVWRDASSYRQERGNVSSWIVAIARSRSDRGEPVSSQHLTSCHRRQSPDTAQTNGLDA